MINTISKRILAIVALVVGFQALALSAQAQQYPQFGTALRGYDAVAYQTENKAVQGDSNNVVYYQGLTYMFKSKENAETFKTDPERYVPVYNGYCAMGVALGKKLPIDPEAFKVVDGRLYMNLNKDVQKAWLRDIQGNIAKANSNWTDIHSKHPNDL